MLSMIDNEYDITSIPMFDKNENFENNNSQAGNATQADVDMKFDEKDTDAVLRMFRIAKNAGCKFYLGSDAHHPDHLERTKVILPDSTQVWLNSASRLSYTDAFMTKNREVQISGEAFFDVVRKNDMPFVVKFQENTITVKGTKFNVTAYGMEDKVYAALVEGKIEFAGSTVKVDMNPGEMLSYDMTTKDILKCKADLSSQISWVDGRLDYSSITLEQFLTRLSSIYGFKVDYRPHKYVNHTFCINLSTNESLNDVLDAISIIVPISWSYSDGVVTVTEK